MVKASKALDRVLVLEMVRVTEAAAIAASKLIGRGDEKAADHAAVEAMREAFNGLEFDGTVVIGEGERDEAPMLYIGEKVGSGIGTGPKIDIALDPLEGTTITAKAGPNALAVLAIAEEGGLLNAPDVYMDKLAIGPGYADGIVGLDRSPTENVKALAKAKGVEPDERAMLCEAFPDLYYFTDHYRDYPLVLIRLSRADAATVTSMLDRTYQSLLPKRRAKT